MKIKITNEATSRKKVKKDSFSVFQKMYSEEKDKLIRSGYAITKTKLGEAADIVASRIMEREDYLVKEIPDFVLNTNNLQFISDRKDKFADAADAEKKSNPNSPKAKAAAINALGALFFDMVSSELYKREMAKSKK